MKPFSNPKIKTYCYKNDCKIIESGFQSREDFFYVCVTCHEEVTERLKDSIESRKNPIDTNVEEWDTQLCLPFILP